MLYRLSFIFYRFFLSWRVIIMVSIYIRLGLSRLVCISKFAIRKRVMILYVGILIRVKRVTT